MSQQRVANLFGLDQKNSALEILYPTLPHWCFHWCALHRAWLLGNQAGSYRHSGQNTWLSYYLLKASEPGPFSVQALQTQTCSSRAWWWWWSRTTSLVHCHTHHGLGWQHSRCAGWLQQSGGPHIPRDLRPHLRLSGSSNYSLLHLPHLCHCVAGAHVMVLAHLTSTPGCGGWISWCAYFSLGGRYGVVFFLQSSSQETSPMTDFLESSVIFPQPNYDNMLISQEHCQKDDPLCV